MVEQGFARTQDDIARLMRMSPSLVVRLEQRDLIERQRDPANRRKHILTLTGEGNPCWPRRVRSLRPSTPNWTPCSARGSAASWTRRSRG